MMALRRLGTPMARSRVLTPAVWPGLPTEPALSRLGGDAYLSATASTPSSIRPLCSSSSTGSSWWSKVSAKSEPAMETIKEADANIKATLGVLASVSGVIMGSTALVVRHVEKRSETVIDKEIKKERKKRLQFKNMAIQGHLAYALKTNLRYNCLQGHFNDLQQKCNVYHEKEICHWNQISRALSQIKTHYDKIEQLLANTKSNQATECNYELQRMFSELKSEMDRLQLLMPQSAAENSTSASTLKAGESNSEEVPLKLTAMAQTKKDEDSPLAPKPPKANEGNSEEVLSKLTATAQTKKDEDSPPGPKPPKKKPVKTDESSSQELVPSKKTEAHQTVEENAPDLKPPKI